MVKTSTRMKASSLRMPAFWINSNNSTSKPVISTPQSTGMPDSCPRLYPTGKQFKPMADPSTSARSQAAMAISHSTNKT